MHNKLVKAVNLGLSETTDWFDILIPTEYQNHPTSSYTENRNTNCPCNMAVTECDYSKISRGMPPRMWKHILRECFGISDADLYKAEYKNWFKSIESSIFDALVTWSQAQEIRLSKKNLYGKLAKARNMGLCETTEWFDFLIHPDCQNHLPPFTEVARPQYKKLSIMQECSVKLIPNPVYIHIMLTSFFIKFLYVSMLTSCALPFSVDMQKVWVWYLAIYGIMFVLLHFLPWNSDMNAQVITTISELIPKHNFLILISAVIHFMLLIEEQNKIVEVLKNEEKGNCPIISFTYGIVLSMIQTPLLFSFLPRGSTHMSSFRFMPHQDIVAVYGQWKPQRFFHEILLSCITWSTSGMIIAYFVRHMASPTTMFYTSCFTAIIIIFIWVSTLDADSICLWIDLFSFFKNIKAKICSSPCFVSFAIIVLFCCYFVIFGAVMMEVFKLKNVSDDYTISDKNNELITVCLSTLVVLNIQRIFDFYPEEKRRPHWEMFIFIILYLINSGLGASNFRQCSGNPWVDSLIFPLSGFIPIDMPNVCQAAKVNQPLTKMMISNIWEVASIY